jgi:hypothetical protein
MAETATTTASAGESVTETTDTDPSGQDREPTTAGAEPRLGDRWILIAATAAACLPIVVAVARALRHGWKPTGDDAFPTIRAGDVFTTNPPLIGWWSSASQYAGRQLNHPGPLQFDFLALPVKLFGPGAGTAIGMGLINAGSLLVIAWLLRRRMDPAFATLAMGAAALLVWAMGSEMLYEPWTMYATVLPFAAFLVAAWSVASGDPVASVPMVVAGSFAFQTHLTYSLLVPLVSLLAVLWAARATIARRFVRRPAPQEPPAAEASSGGGAEPGGGGTAPPVRVRRWVLISLATLLLMWAQPLYENFFAPEGSEGNLRALIGARDVENPTPSWEQALGAFGGTVAVPPMWLPPSYGDPAFTYFDPGPPIWLSGGALALLAVALVVLGRRAAKRGSTAVVAGIVVGFACLPIGLLTTLRMPMPYTGVPDTYSRFMWPLGMVVWLALAVAVLDEVRARGWLTGRWRLALPGLALAILGGAAGLPTVDHGAQPQWTRDALDTLDDDMIRAIDEAGGGPVLVNIPFHTTSAYVAPALFYELQDAGIDFKILDEDLARQIGRHRLFEDGDTARLKLTVLGGSFADTIGSPTATRVAYWSELDDDDRAELRELTAELKAIIAERGVVLNEGGERFLDEWTQGGPMLREKLKEAQADPDSVLYDRTLLDLYNGTLEGNNMLDETVFPAEIMEPWSRVAALDNDRQMALLLEPMTD